MPDPIPANLLRWTCEPDEVEKLLEEERKAKDETTRLAFHASGVIGQERALEAIRLGIDITSPGYHIFVTGLAGSGRSYTIQSILKKVAKRCCEPQDRCFVHNFRDEASPSLLTLPRGKGHRLQKEMRDLVREVSEAVTALFEDEKLQKERERIANRFQESEQKQFADFEQRLNAEGLAPVTVQKGPFTISDIFPLVDGKPVPFEQVEQDEELSKQLPPEELEKRRESAKKFMDELQTLIKKARKSARSMIEEVREVEKKMVARTINGLIGAVQDEFPDCDGVSEWLDQVAEHMLDNLETFKKGDDDEPPAPARPRRRRDAGALAVGHPHRIYDVNVVNDTEDQEEKPPIVIERNPTWTNLFGVVERDLEPNGMVATDFMHIHGGSLLRADGGYLVMYCRDVLLEPGVWRTLVRTLKSGQLEIRSPETLLLAPTMLKPEPIPFNLKVILIGDERYYQLLDFYEEDFHKVFKIKSEFDTRIRRTDDNVRGFMTAVNKIVETEKLRELDPEAHSALLEEAARRAGRRNRISTRFGEIADLVRESNHFASETPHPNITRADVQSAIEAHRRRHGLVDDRLQELLMEELLLVDTDGRRIGQVNGLAVYGTGSIYFGKPSRISATVGVGNAGIVNIEREARLSGSTHDKGVLILSGYLRTLFGRNDPLTLSASLAFEQSYGGVDGDSATCAEFFALLSSIGDIPLRQDVAVTGSMNQLGDVQAVGGVNEKIEGFFRLCKERGLTGQQGCVIPLANVEDLMLQPDVIEAAAAGKFHIWAVKRVEEALEIVSERTAGEPDEHGRYPEGSVYRTVHDRLKRWTKIGQKATSDTVKIEAQKGWERPTPDIPEDPTVPGPGNAN